MSTNFLLETKKDSNENMIITKQKAMQMKKDYIKNNFGKKEDFLEKYTKSNKMLEEDYKDYSIDEESLKIIIKMNLQIIIKQRK